MKVKSQSEVAQSCLTPEPLEKEMVTNSSVFENSMDRGAWWATYSPWSHKDLDTTE